MSEKLWGYDLLINKDENNNNTPLQFLFGYNTRAHTASGIVIT